MSSIRLDVLWLVYFALPLLAVLFPADNSQGFFEKARHRTFNKREIQTMEQTTATIETKFGEITLKFFPEAAPNHVNSFITLANDGIHSYYVIPVGACDGDTVRKRTSHQNGCID